MIGIVFACLAHGKRVMCEICGVLTNSQTQAQSHLNGRKHLTRLAELGMPVPRDVAVDFLEASSQSLRRNNKINRGKFVHLAYCCYLCK